MKETGLWKKLKNGLRLDMLERIENKVAAGWPDVYCYHSKRETWIELKSEKKMPKHIDFEPAQPNWHHHYASIGGTSYIWLHVVSEGMIYVWAGKDARALNELGTEKVNPIAQALDDQDGLDYLFVKFFM